MRTHAQLAAPRLALHAVACEPESPWEARGFADLVPPATLPEARARRDELAGLLARERAAAADFLLALADFDRRRGWERLGHASLFAFLTRELGLSAGAAQLRLSAARLLPRHAAVESALRSGRLCISAVGQLARVLTPANEAEVLPRFLGRSAREAQEVVAAILPAPCPPHREVVTLLSAAPVTRASADAPSTAPTTLTTAAVEVPPLLAPPMAGAPLPDPLHTYEVPAPARVALRTPAVEPVTADLRRLHLTVSKGFLDKVAEARVGLSHALPGATTEQVLEAALDLLLERQAARKALVRKPRSAVKAGAKAAASPTPTASPLTPSPSTRLRTSCAPPARSRGAPTPNPVQGRPHLPAPIEREVRLRDGDRCQHPLDSGGTCGSRWQVELDHIVPLALGGATEVSNLRCLCRRHHSRVTEEELGAVVAQGARRRGG